MAEAAIKQTVLVECGSASCSGIILSTQHGCVLTHATLILPHLIEQPEVSRQLLKTGQLSYSACRQIGPVKVTCERRKDGVVCNKLSSVSLGRDDGLLEDSDTIRISGHVSRVWFANGFKKTVSSLFPAPDKWTFVDEAKSADKTNDENRKAESQMANYSVLFLPCFVLLSVGDALRQFSTATILHTSHQQLAVGHTAYVIATPFGNLSPAVFLNSVSKGIISNVVGTDAELILTDARCIPGAEGGALYTDFNCSSFPVGMIVAPLCWKAGEWIGLSLACRMKTILHSLKKVLNSSSETCEIPSLLAGMHEKHQRLFENVGVVMVCTRSGSWGSGVIVDWSEGFVLTCSHVVKGDREVTVHSSLPVVRKFTADVIAATDGAKVYDLALLKTRKFNLSGRKISVDVQPLEGDRVYIIGHAAWGVNHRLNASVTSGVISKIVRHSNQPVLIQTSCCVNAGASGGPLLSQSGRLLGIAVCNARDTLNDAWYPHVNMCIPIGVLWPAIDAYMNTGDGSALQCHFTANSSAVQRLWSLQTENSHQTACLTSKL